MGGIETRGSCIEEGVDLRLLGPEERDREIARLERPWVAQEGPLEATLQRFDAGPLLLRGLAFDSRTTVFWDEDAVQVVRASPAQEGVTACVSDVLKEERFTQPANLQRVDYLKSGSLVASRYLAVEDSNA